MRYKEIRMIFIVLLIALAGGVLAITSALSKDVFRTIIAVTITFLSLSMLLRYNNVIGDDYCMVYYLKMIAILPEMFEFNEIECVTLENDHKVVIQLKNKKVNAYMTHADEFVEEVNKKRQAYLNK